MPPKKRLRSTSSLSGDRNQTAAPSTAEHESFEALHDHEPSQTSADDIDADISGNSGSEAVGTRSSDGTEDIEGCNDVGNQFGGISVPLGPGNSADQDDVVMLDDPISDGSTPWLDYLHDNDNPYSPDLPFGLQLAHTSSLSTNATHDNGTSDEDAGGVSLIAQPSAEGLYQAEWNIQHPEDLDFSSPDHYMAFDPPSEAELQAMGQPQNQDEFTATHVQPPSDLPFGVMAVSDSIFQMPHQPSITLPSVNTLMAPVAMLTAIDDLPPVMPSLTNHTILGSENVGLIDFLRLWAHLDAPRSAVPDIEQVRVEARRAVHEVQYENLCGDYCDLQGINWAGMGIPRAAARTQRHKLYKNYVNKHGSDKWTGERREKWVAKSENYFRFRKTIFRPDVNLAHFQLRSVLATPSRAQAYYPTSKGIYQLNPLTLTTEMVFDLGEFTALNRAVTTLDAACGVLVAGTFGGEYIIKSLQTQNLTNHSEGTITNPMCGITNHLQVHTQRYCASPVAAISSNDRGFRVLDIETEQFISDFIYHFPLNCSAVSPDRRLRVLVGDSKDVAITNVETGETEVELRGHKDYGFSCDWSDDGFTVATGFQDKSVKIWDARKWTNSNREPTPLSVWCDMAGARNLKFSPLGSGKQVLVSAEEADYINVFDAKRGDPNSDRDFENHDGFQSKQTIDIFGEIGGVSFSDEGHELNVLVCDPHKGGLVQFERATLGSRKQTMIERVPIF